MKCFNLPLFFSLLISLVTTVSLPGPAQAQPGPTSAKVGLAGEVPEPFESDDEDLRVEDTYFVMDVAASGAIAGFGVGAVVGGIENFIMAASSGGQASSQYLFAGLTFVSLGSASLVSGIRGIDESYRSWKSRRRAMWRAGPVERRALREREVLRLRRRTRAHAMGIAADGTFLGLGIAMAFIGPPGQATPLIVNGAFVLGLDIFQLVLDDQTARAWGRRNEGSSAGFFGVRTGHRGPRIVAAGLSPLPAPSGDKGKRPPGLAFQLAGVF
jgi:hypothetical protein